VHPEINVIQMNTLVEVFTILFYTQKLFSFSTDSEWKPHGVWMSLTRLTLCGCWGFFRPQSGVPRKPPNSL